MATYSPPLPRPPEQPMDTYATPNAEEDLARLESWFQELIEPATLFCENTVMPLDDASLQISSSRASFDADIELMKLMKKYNMHRATGCESEHEAFDSSMVKPQAVALPEEDPDYRVAALLNHDRRHGVRHYLPAGAGQIPLAKYPAREGPKDLEETCLLLPAQHSYEAKLFGWDGDDEPLFPSNNSVSLPAQCQIMPGTVHPAQLALPYARRPSTLLPPAARVAVPLPARAAMHTRVTTAPVANIPAVSDYSTASSSGTKRKAVAAPAPRALKKLAPAGPVQYSKPDVLTPPIQKSAPKGAPAQVSLSVLVKTAAPRPIHKSAPKGEPAHALQPMPVTLSLSVKKPAPGPIHKSALKGEPASARALQQTPPSPSRDQNQRPRASVAPAPAAPNPDIPCGLNGCREMFKSNIALVGHRQSAAAHAPIVAFCPGCPGGFTCAEHLRTHLDRSPGCTWKQSVVLRARFLAHPEIIELQRSGALQETVMGQWRSFLAKVFMAQRGLSDSDT